LRAERTHLCKISGRAKAEEECDGEDKENGVATSAAKVHRCFGVKLATTYACNAAIALTSYPSLAHSFSGTDTLLHLNQTHTRAVTCGKSQSGSQVHVHGANTQKGSMVSILRPSTIFAKRAPMVSETNFEQGQAYDAHERAVSCETSPRAWRANVRSIEIYIGLTPVPEYFCEPVDGLRGAQLKELLELGAEKNMSLITPSVTPPIEGLSDMGKIHRLGSDFEKTPQVLKRPHTRPWKWHVCVSLHHCAYVCLW